MWVLRDMPKVVPLALRGDDVKLVVQVLWERAQVTTSPEQFLQLQEVVNKLTEATVQAKEIEREGTAV